MLKSGIKVARSWGVAPSNDGRASTVGIFKAKYSISASSEILATLVGDYNYGPIFKGKKESGKNQLLQVLLKRFEDFI